MTGVDVRPGASYALAAGGLHTALLLERARDVLEPSFTTFVDQFYEHLAGQPGLSEVLARLTSEDLDWLKTHQVEHLHFLLDPALAREHAFEQGRQTGRVHSLVGVEIDWYASAVAHYQSGIFELLGTFGDAREQCALQQVVSARLVHTLEGALRGHRDLQEQQAEVLHSVGDVLDRAETVADLARVLLGVLTDLEGIAAGSFGRPDAKGRFQFEIGVGAGITEFTSDGGGAPITTDQTHSSGQGPGGRAWRSGEIVTSDAYYTDPTTAPWHELGRRHGWRSSATLPLLGSNGGPRALIVLYATWPGYFAHSSRGALLTQVRRAVEPALSRLESRRAAATHVVRFSERSGHLEKLDAGEVVMHYQPVVELATGRPLKLEALARLGKAGQLVPPSEFLPAFGDNELFRLFEIGLDQALGSLVRWQSEGLETGVSLNLPASSAADRRYVGAVQSALGRHAIEPSRLTLELLETSSIDGALDGHSRGLDDLKRLGVRLAEDDLGSGYSSLLRLRHIAFDEVKLDQELMRGAESAPRAALHFIQPLTSLARSMGLTTSVEGLETPGLIEAAVLLGADAGQGYAIARPMHATAVQEWSHSYRLKVDRERPSTWLGGLAAHLVWENRLAALARRAGMLGRVARNSCALTDYIRDREGDRSELAVAHRALHAVTIRSAGTSEHAHAWELLEKLLIGAHSA